MITSIESVEADIPISKIYSVAPTLCNAIKFKVVQSFNGCHLESTSWLLLVHADRILLTDISTSKAMIPLLIKIISILSALDLRI